MNGFAWTGFPNCRGIIEGTHIPIVAPDHLASEYINRKRYFSLVLQVLVDQHGHFMDINAGWSGKVLVWKSTHLSEHWPVQEAESGNFLPSPEDHHGGNGNVHSDPWRPCVLLNAVAHEPIHREP